jgi:protein O-GlcNAc transferase
MQFEQTTLVDEMSISKKKLLEICKDLYQQQRWAELLEHTERALRLKTHRDDVLLLNMAGAAARAVGDPVKAESFWGDALKYDPKNSHVLNNMGIAHRESGRLESALNYFRRAIEVAPTAAIHNNLGVLFYNLRRFKEAADEYQKAVKINPQYAEAWANLGNAFKDLQQSALALKAYEKALELNPDFAWALSCMAHIQQKLANPTKAIEYANRARQIEPENAEIQLTSLNTLLPLRPETEKEGADYLRAFGQRLEELSRWTDEGARLKKLGERVGYSQPYFIAYRKGNHKDVLSRYGNLMCNASKAYRPNIYITAKPLITSRKIRFGIVSGFIFRHSVWDIILKGIVLNLDPSRFELCICHTGSTTDDQTEIAKSKSFLYIQGPKTHDDWVKTLMGLELDVLMYPEVGMDPYSMQMATLRIAPLQMTSWGHPMTSGLPTLDWYLSGDLLEPAQAQEHYTEKLIRLSGVGVCTYQLEIQPRQLILKNESGNLYEGKVCLYLCQHAFKYTDEAIDLLGRVAQEIPEAVLVIVKDNKYPQAFNIAVDQLKRKFRDLALDHSSRIFLLPWMNRAQFLGSFEHVHIYLDLPGFSGYTTAWQAMSQGCPVVTLEGEFLRQRLASGLLRAIGEKEYIARDEKEYIGIVSKLSNEVLTAGEEASVRRLQLKQKISDLNEDVEPVRQLESQIIYYFQSGKTQVNNASVAKHEVGNAALTSRRHPSLIYLAQLSDVYYLAENAHLVSEATLICTDPYIMEIAQSKKLKNLQLKRLSVDQDFQQRIVTETYARSIVLDGKLERIRREMLDSNPHPGWDAQLYGMFLSKVLTFRELAPSIDKMLQAIGHCGVFSPTFAQHLYFDSRTAISVLAGRSDFLTISGYYENSPNWRSDVNDWTFNFGAIRNRLKDGKLNAIINIPTCFHQKDYFSTLIINKYKNFSDLPSLMWDVPVKRTADDLLVNWKTQIGSDIKAKIEEYTRSVRAVWTDELEDIIHDKYDLSVQVEYFVDRCAMQAATYLCAREVITKDLDFVISDHDLGYMGPLFSAARLKQCDITVLPHSSVTGPLSFIPHGERLTLVQAYVRKNRITSILGDEIFVAQDTAIQQSLKLNRSRVDMSRKVRICLLLNTLYSTGLSYVDIFEIRSLYRALKEYCDSKNHDLFVRPKPSGAATTVLATTLEISLETVLDWTRLSMGEVVDRTDVCICFGEETTALYAFHEAGVNTILYWNQRYPHNYWTALDKSFIRTHKIDELISQIDAYLHARVE